MINLVTLEQALINCPAIGCSMPSINVSDRYKLISTKNIIQKGIDDGWRIFETYQAGKSVTSEHIVLMTHDVILNNNEVMQHGYPFICIINSHNGKQGFKYVLGYHSFSSDTRIFAEDAYMENCHVNHRKHNEEEIFAKLNNTKIYIKSFLESLYTFKDRVLSQKEVESFNSFCNNKLKKKIQLVFEEQNDLWKITNDVHKQLGKSLKQNMKFSQRFWRAICSSMIFFEDDLQEFLENE